MAEYLLTGWTMLADACPNISPTGCSYPLMRSPEGDVVCVFCSQIEGDEKSSDSQQNTPSQQATQNQNGIINQGRGWCNNDISSNLGALLLQGYKMTAENCAGCRIIPLMLSPNEDDLICVQCGKNFNQVSATEDAAARSSSVAEPSASVVSPQADQQFDSSSLLSKKLLEGYTMLEECCTRCLIPIMRDRSGVEQCIICNNQQSNTQDLIPPSLISRGDNKLSVADEKNNETEKTTTREVPPPSSEPPMRISNIESGGVAVTLAEIRNDISRRTHQAICSHAMNVTYRKLANTTQLLETTECVDLSKKIAELITSLANAAAALNSLDH